MTDYVSIVVTVVDMVVCEVWLCWLLMWMFGFGCACDCVGLVGMSCVLCVG